MCFSFPPSLTMMHLCIILPHVLDAPGFIHAFCCLAECQTMAAIPEPPLAAHSAQRVLSFCIWCDYFSFFCLKSGDVIRMPPIDRRRPQATGECIIRRTLYLVALIWVNDITVLHARRNKQHRRARTHAHLDLHTCAHTHIHTHIHTHTRTHARTHTHLYLETHVVSGVSDELCMQAGTY